MGIQAAKPKNSAMLIKLNWRFKTEKASLWVQVLSHKYCGQRSRSTSFLNVTSCSPIWAGIKKGEDTVSKGAKWIAGSNSGLSLWYDKWLDTGTLRSRICGPLNKGEEDIRLKDVASFFGWNWMGLSFDFPKSILLDMKATPIPFSNQREDKLS